MEKKILVSDYDQTFYINDKDIEINKKEVENFRKKGNVFILATGRSYLDFKNKVNLYNIKYDFVILNHGTTILDIDDNIIFNCSINNEIIKDIKNDLLLKESINNFCTSKLESRVDFNHINITKIHVKYTNKDIAMKISSIINKKYSKYVNSYYVTNNSVEIISSKTNKSNAINILRENLHINKSNVYTIGDGYSDIEMIKDFNGYCMKESVKELKEFSIKEVESVSILIKELLKDE